MPDSKDARIKKLEAQLAANKAQADATIAELRALLARATTARPPFALSALTASFGSTLEQSQTRAGERAEQGVAAVLQTLDVELRGFVDLKGDTPQLVLPRQEDKVVPESLSVVKMVFATIPPAAPSSELPTP